MNSLYCTTKYVVLLILPFIVVLSGCTGSQALVDKKYTAGASDTFVLEIRNEAAAPATEMELLTHVLDRGLTKQNLKAEEANRVLQVTVTKYRFRSEATRILTGNMTGSDAIVSTVIVKRSEDGEILGKEEIVTHNPTVVSKSEDLINAHAEKIISSLGK